MSEEATPVVKRFGTVALIGRPNAGKSTLLNRILGEKVAIVSDKPQTTRNKLVGILNQEEGQAVIVDTPGIHKPLHKMNVRMMDHVVTTLMESDVAATLVDVSEEFGHGEEFVLQRLLNAPDHVCVPLPASSTVRPVQAADALTRPPRAQCDEMFF
jgi:GTP-binding protein Era